MPSEPQQITFLGPQANSLKESAPAIGFSKAKRESFSKGEQTPGPIYDSQYSPRTGGNYSFGTGPGVGQSSTLSRPDAAYLPGPGAYQVRTEVLGQSKTSLFRNSPAYSMGKPGKIGAGRMSTAEGCGSGKFYSTSSPVGNQVDSTKKNPAAFSFGTAQRFGSQRSDLRRNMYNPGPGAYSISGTTGSTAFESTSRTNPAFRFGSARRFDDPSHSISLSARGSPGPAYQVRSSTGPQLVSTMRTSQAFGFGTQPRFGRSSSATTPGLDSPGPGAYNA
mmetsp:Transcript_7629/g.23820  ORF Transcript_7629/g.23820 Transcript_7629/m.23820 type:complete len:277 (-) Transcript_7629:374-1204(-)|eukprot:scaffold176333_cov28-Tisochrysis_lutea.AAC.2